MNENSQNSLRQISETELKEMLEAHSQWLGSGGKTGRLANFSNTLLDRMDFRSCDLRQGNFQGASLVDAILKDACLQETDFRNANLKGADLQKSVFDNAIFIKANLDGAYLQKSVFPAAIFQEANLEGVMIQGADLESSIGLVQEQLNTVQWGDKHTKLPPGLNLP